MCKSSDNDGAAKATRYNYEGLDVVAVRLPDGTEVHVDLDGGVNVPGINIEYVSEREFNAGEAR